MKSILQTKEWADFKGSQGFKILKLDNLFIHRRELPLGQNFLYAPEVSSKFITAQNMDSLKKMTDDQKSIFSRIEFIDEYSENADKIIRSFGFVKAFEEVQPKWRHIIDLTLSQDEILSQMKSKGRYNIRLAERKGVEVNAYKCADGGCKDKVNKFYDLISGTVDRKGIAGRSKKYFEDLVDNFSKKDYFVIYIASYNDNPLATALVSFYDDVASYLYGGSSSKNREVMAPYLLHWQIIKDARSRGMKKYDLLGRSKPGDKKSNWLGVTRFKEKFGGEPRQILGSYDFINKPVMYKGFEIIEKIRRGGNK